MSTYVASISPGFITQRFDDSTVSYSDLIAAMVILEYSVPVQRMVILYAQDDEFQDIVSCASILSTGPSGFTKE